MKILSTNDWIIGNVSVIHNTPALVTSSVSWKETALSRGMHRLEVDFEVVLPSADDVNNFEAFLLQIQGRANPFILDLGADGSWHNPLTQPFNMTLSTAAGINNTTLRLTESRDVALGAKFQIGTDTKIYTVVESDRNDQTIDIYPALRYQQPVGAVLNFKNPRPVLRVKDDKTAAIKYGDRNTVYKLSCTEVMQ